MINEYSWEYNDEYNYTTEGNPGFPAYVFLDRADAGRACNLLNAHRFAGLQPFEYVYDGLGSISSLDEEDVCAQLVEIIGREEVGLDASELLTLLEAFTIPPELTDEQYMAIAEVFDCLSFYEVTEVEVRV